LHLDEPVGGLMGGLTGGLTGVSFQVGSIQQSRERGLGGVM